MRLLRINHLGIAATGLDEAMARMARLFDMAPDHTEAVPEQKVRTAFFPVGGPGGLAQLGQGEGSAPGQDEGQQVMAIEGFGHGGSSSGVETPESSLARIRVTGITAPGGPAPPPGGGARG